MNHEIHEKHEKILFKDESYAIQVLCLKCIEKWVVVSWSLFIRNV